MATTAKMPSVTEVLADLGLSSDYTRVPPNVLEWASLVGTAVHAAIRYHHEGDLDEASVAGQPWEPGFRAYLRFVKDTGHVPIASEMELVHPVWHYLGHPDRVGWLGTDRAIIDWKHTARFDEDYVRRQVAGYKMLWNATHPMEPCEKAFGLHLKRDGTYSLYDLTDPLAEQEFLACLLVYRARQRRRG